MVCGKLPQTKYLKNDQFGSVSLYRGYFSLGAHEILNKFVINYHIHSTLVHVNDSFHLEQHMPQSISPM